MGFFTNTYNDGRRDNMRLRLYLLLMCVFLCAGVNAHAFNYAEALQKSLYFMMPKSQDQASVVGF